MRFVLPGVMGFRSSGQFPFAIPKSLQNRYRPNGIRRVAGVPSEHRASTETIATDVTTPGVIQSASVYTCYVHSFSTVKNTSPCTKQLFFSTSAAATEVIPYHRRHHHHLGAR